MSIHVFGIRHHGPGSARSLRLALEELQPDIVLVEGPPDAEEVIPLLASEEMKPPVALLIYSPDNPRRSVYYPFTYFSPEWQALSYALKHSIPARFMDLPQAIQLAKEPEESQSAEGPLSEKENESPTSEVANAVVPATTPGADEPAERNDPFSLLARAVGYDDHELWWEQQIEQRQNTNDLFAAILEIMGELRTDPAPREEREAQREAWMRQSIRTAQKEGFQRIAVVCGAMHAPVLADPGPEKADADLLKGLKTIKVNATWIPWTNSRLSYKSGYGAGVTSPGWYEHLWTTSDRVSIRWVTHAARLLREQGLDASSASVIEAVRLSEALAAMRSLPMPGLDELHEAIKTVLCNGNSEPMQLIRNKLEIGDRLGEVPSAAPMVPLQRDLEIHQRRLRLKPSTEIVKLDLDLRKDTDRARSRLLHRLNLLSIPWGKLQRVGSKVSTFHEIWQIQWQVEFIVALIEANVWGNTVEEAATGLINDRANTLEELPELTKLLDAAIPAELSGAVEHLLQAIQRRAAIAADVHHLMDSLPPLARVARYGDVRGTSGDQVLPIIDGLFERAIIGLPGACSSLDDDAAARMIESINNVQESVSLLNRDDQRAEWQRVIRGLMERENIHGLVRGRCCRLLLEQQVIDGEELQRLTGLALSTAVPAPQAASWIEGVLQGSGMVVLHQDGLWTALDYWLSELTPEAFEALLPILRRAFSDFQPPERRAMGEKVKHLHHTQTTTGRQMTEQMADLDVAKADSVLPVLAQIMGVKLDGH